MKKHLALLLCLQICFGIAFSQTTYYWYNKNKIPIKYDPSASYFKLVNKRGKQVLQVNDGTQKQRQHAINVPLHPSARR
jgi:hypothetical protein